MNLFEIATRKKYRFESAKGLLQVEDLWTIRMRGGEVNIDDIAKSLRRQLRDSEEESFVNVRKKSNTDIENKLELVKYIISVRLAEEEDARNAAVRREQRVVIQEALAERRNADLRNKSEEELLALLNGFDEADQT